MYYNETLDEKGLQAILLNFISGKAPNINDWEYMCDVGHYKFYKEYYLRKLLMEKGLTVLKCNDVPSNSIRLETADLQILLNYVANNQINSIFYCYHCVNMDAFDISKVNVGKDNDLLKIAKTDIEEYENKIQSLDFNQPAILNLFCLHNGIAISIQINDSWLDDLLPAREFLIQLKKKYENDLNNLKSYREKERESILEELRAILLSNSDFSLCTNQNLRREFMRKFLSREENERYMQAFVDNDGYLNSYEFSNFADLAYAVLRQSKKK